MTCGTHHLADYQPNRDAMVVRRLIGAGATIKGKLNMDAFASAGSGELSEYGIITNPREPTALAGGSSGGGAAAVVAGDIDVAIGTDQGGSIRIPASRCGCVGLKPTYGLVPYTGIVSGGYSLDHVGPIANCVTDCALVLEIIAGPDDFDARQPAVESGGYVDTMKQTRSLTVARLIEGFDASNRGVARTVLTSLKHFESSDVSIRTVSVPTHVDVGPVGTAISVVEQAELFHFDGVGRIERGWVDCDYAAAFQRSYEDAFGTLPPTIVTTLIVDQLLEAENRGVLYGKARNLVRDLTRAYDAVLADVDVLALPTTPCVAHERASNLDTSDLLERAGNMSVNTKPSNLTDHPAITVPSGTVDGQPVGVTFVGDRFDDRSVLRAAREFERSVD